jgi:hypothetical protein
LDKRRACQLLSFGRGTRLCSMHRERVMTAGSMCPPAKDRYCTGISRDFHRSFMTRPPEPPTMLESAGGAGSSADVPVFFTTEALMTRIKEVTGTRAARSLPRRLSG